MVPRTRFVVALVLAFAGLAADARAADPLYDPTPIARNDEWIVSIKGTVGLQPRWPGADDYMVFGYPGIGFRRAGEPERFTAPDDGASISVYDTSWLRIGPVARYVGGRYFSDDRRLFGLEDVRWSVEPGVFVDLWASTNLRARMEIRHGINGHDGFVGNLGIDWVQPFDRFTFSIGPRAAWGDSDYTRTYFGVTPAEAALNGVVAPYRARGGLTSVGALASATYVWSERWSTTVFGGYDRLVSDAGDSPIVRAFGSRDQFSVGVSAGYSFRTKSFW